MQGSKGFFLEIFFIFFLKFFLKFFLDWGVESIISQHPPLLRRFGVVPPVAIHFTSSNESPDVTRLKLWQKKLKFLPQRLQGSLL